jgi:hypothetical protein
MWRVFSDPKLFRIKVHVLQSFHLSLHALHNARGLLMEPMMKELMRNIRDRLRAIHAMAALISLLRRVNPSSPVLKEAAAVDCIPFRNHQIGSAACGSVRTDLSGDEINTVHTMLKQIEYFKSSISDDCSSPVENSVGAILAKVQLEIISALKLDVRSESIPCYSCPICANALPGGCVPRSSSIDCSTRKKTLPVERPFEYIEALPCTNCQIAIDVCCYTYTTIPVIGDAECRGNVLKCSSCSSIAHLPTKIIESSKETSTVSFDWAYDSFRDACLKCPYCHVLMTPLLF